MAWSACSHKQDATETQTDNPPQQASNYLQQFVYVGETRSNLISTFGTPNDEFTTEMHQVAITFLISPLNREAYAAHATGFTVYCTNNVVTYWLPAFRVY